MEIIIAVALITVCSATMLMMIKTCIETEDLVGSWASAMTGGGNFAMVVYWIIQLAEMV